MTEQEQVLKWVLSGASDAEITEAIAAAYPNANAAQLLTETTKELRDAARINPKLVLGWSLLSTKFLYQKMVEIGDFTGALRATKQLTDLANKYHSQKTRRNLPQTQTIVMLGGDVENYRRRIADRIARISDNNRGHAAD